MKIFLIKLLFSSSLCFSQMIGDSSVIMDIVQNGFKTCQIIIEGQVISQSYQWNTELRNTITLNEVRVDRVLKDKNQDLKKGQFIFIMSPCPIDSESEGLHKGEMGMFLLDKTKNAIENSSLPQDLQFNIHNGLFFEYNYTLKQDSTQMGPLRFGVGQLYKLSRE